LAGIGYLLVSIVVTFVTRLVPELIIGSKPNSSMRAAHLLKEEDL